MTGSFILGPIILGVGGQIHVDSVGLAIEGFQLMVLGFYIDPIFLKKRVLSQLDQIQKCVKTSKTNRNVFIFLWNFETTVGTNTRYVFQKMKVRKCQLFVFPFI